MKKKLLAFMLPVLFVFVFVAASCGADKPKPVEKAGTSTVILDAKGAIDDYTAQEVMYIAAGKLQTASTYTMEKAGETVAKKGVISYTQSTTGIAVKNGDESYFESKSNSALLSMAHQAFKKGDKVVYRDAQSGALSVATDGDYRQNYGILPGSVDFTNYILNKDTIVFAEAVANTATDERTYRYVIKEDEATVHLRTQMKRFGGLVDVNFTSQIELKLTVKSDFTPVRIESTERYEIELPLLGEMDCTQNFTAEYSDINGAVTVPDSAAFNDKIGSAPTVIVPSAPQETDPALARVIEGFMNTDLANGVAAVGSLSVKTGDTTMSVPLDFGVKFDLERFQSHGVSSALFVTARATVVGKTVAVYYNGDQKLYVNVDGAKYAFAVPEVGAAPDGATEVFETLMELTQTEDGVRFNLSEEATAALGAVLGGFGLDPQQIYFDVSLSSERVSGLHASIGGDGFTASLDAVVADRKLVMPTDLASYTAQGMSFKINAITEAFALFQTMELPIEVGMSVDLGALLSGDIASMFQAEVVVKLVEVQDGNYAAGNAIKLISMFLPSMMPDIVLPPLVQAMGHNSASELRLTYAGDGAVHVSVVKAVEYVAGEYIPCTPVVLYYETLDLQGAFGDLIGTATDGGMPSFGLADLTALINGITAQVNFTETGTDIVVSLPSQLTAEIDKGWAALVELIKTNGGGMVGMLGNLDGTVNRADITLSLDERGNFVAAELLITMKQLDKDGLEIETVILRLKLSDFQSIGAFEGLKEYAATMAADERAAKPVRDRFAAVVSLDELPPLTDDAFYTLADQLKADYAALTDAQKALILNEKAFTEKIAPFYQKRAAVASFAQAVGTVQSWTDADYQANIAAYKKFNNQQLDYFTTVYPDAAAAFANARSIWETELAKKLVARIDALSVYADAADMKTLIAFFEECKAIDLAYKALAADKQTLVTNYTALATEQTNCKAASAIVLKEQATTLSARFNSLDTATFSQLVAFTDELKAVKAFKTSIFGSSSIALNAYDDAKVAYVAMEAGWIKTDDAPFQIVAVRELIVSITATIEKEAAALTLQDFKSLQEEMTTLKTLYNDTSNFLKRSNRSKVTNYAALTDALARVEAKISELSEEKLAA